VSERTDEPKCGFCSSPASQVGKLIRGANQSHICDNCVLECLDLIEEQKAEEAASGDLKRKGTFDKPTPKQIFAHLNEYVIGQDLAKKILSVSVYNHYKRIGKTTSTQLGKSNIILIGPTGSGKTFLAETIAKFLQVPFAVGDATGMTEAGYVGEDVESVLVRLLQNADGDVSRAERGIVYIDEIDKIAARGTNGRDISGEGVQQGLLKMLEGSTVTLHPAGKRNSQGPTEQINTRDILFIVGGAFSDITDENSQPKTLGINPIVEDQKQKPPLRHADLVKYGMIPEFVGRFALIAQLHALSVDDLVQILREPKNSIVKQYQEMLAIDGVKLKFTDEFLSAVAERAKREGTGARGLRAIMEPVLLDIMFNAPDDERTEMLITQDMLPQVKK
jgi:ATP-dependent Clp protease ATP-binding subunit ClpX